MNSLWQKIIIRTILKKPKKKNVGDDDYSAYALAKGYREFEILAKRHIKDFFLITMGIFSASFGFKGFLLTNHFIDGGATGISLLVSALTSIPLSILIIGVNIPFIILGYRIMGRAFAIKTALAITGLAVCLATVSFPDVTTDNLLVAVFGGFFLGAGIGLAVRGGAVIDGTEVLAIYLSRKFGTTIGDIIVVINVIIFGAAAYFLGIEIALYSMITYLAASKTLDFIVEGIDEYIGVTIVSSRSDKMRQMIIDKMGRGVTVYSGKGGYGKRGETKEVDIIYTVITRLELNRLNTEIEKIEPTAFVVMNSIKDTKGGMTMKSKIFLSIAIILIAAACKKETPTQTPEKTVPIAEEVLPETPKTECYEVNKNGNVISMQMNYNQDNVSGSLTYAIREKDANTGTFTGQIKDSILIADYTFQSEGMKSTRQIAYKLKGDQIVEGYGDMNEDGTKFKDVNKLDFDSKMPLYKVDCAK